MTMTENTENTVNASKRFDDAPKVAEIPANMAAACDSIAGVGGLFQSADRLLTLAVARALIDATAEGAIPEQVIGQLMRGMTAAKLSSGPAKNATRAMGTALRVAKAYDGAMSGGVALREAGEITAQIFAHETKRRQEARKEREAKKAEEAAAKKREAAAKKREAADKAEAALQESAEPPAPQELVLAGVEGEGFAITLEEFIALRDTLLAMRKASDDHAAAIRADERARSKGDNNYQAEAARLRVA
jgi:hypothetical protein